MVVKVFEQQCDVVDEKAVVKKHTSIEATDSLRKRVAGIARLPARGRPAVFSSILPNVAGW